MFFLKIIQIVKPILILIFLRWVGFNVALEYVFLSSVYVVYLELVNVFAPTDKLYLKSATAKDMLAKVRYRNFINIVFIPFLLIYLYDKVSFLFLFFFIILIFVSVEVNCYYSYFLNKNKISFLGYKVKFFYEFFVWIFYAFLFYLVYAGFVNVELFVLFFILESIVSKWVLIGLFRLKLDFFNGFLYYVKKRKKIFLDFCFSGLLFTWMNYFYRIPFVLGLNIEPLYVIGAQVASALYNIQLSFSDRISKYSFFIFNNVFFIFLFLFLMSVVEFYFFNGILVSFVFLCAVHGVLVYVLLSNYKNKYNKVFYVMVFADVIVIILGVKINPLFFLLNSFLLLFALKYSLRNTFDD